MLILTRGGGTVRTPFEGRHLPANMRTVNRPPTPSCAPSGEQAVATVKSWRIVRIPATPGSGGKAR